MEEQTICPWCSSEIIWDEEIGPEKHCPHCDNELSGYRTMQIGLGDEQDEQPEGKVSQQDWDDEEDDDTYNNSDNLDPANGFIGRNLSRIAAEGNLQQVIDVQEEVPECPSCREYMLEAGEQTIAGQFEPTIHAVVGQPLLQAPFRVKWYVCPSCFTTTTVLSHDDRNQLLEALAPKE